MSRSTYRLLLRATRLAFDGTHNGELDDMLIPPQHTHSCYTRSIHSLFLCSFHTHHTHHTHHTNPPIGDTRTLLAARSTIRNKFQENISLPDTEVPAAIESGREVAAVLKKHLVQGTKKKTDAPAAAYSTFSSKARPRTGLY